MKCEEQHPDGTYQECQLDLGHTRDHEYFGTTWARPVPAEPDPDVADLIERAARKSHAWDLDEVKWPIVVEVTSVYVIKAPGATEDEALKYWADSDEYPDVDGEQAIDGGFEIRRVDRWQRGSLTGAPIGPEIACPDCGEQAMRRKWFHNPFRKCHGPIEWRENTHARTLQWRYRREFKATPMAVSA
ncbi:hypothetical protein [Streptomyces sp. NPDC058092]|uniref:hypothetical protein n=1 Tax=Streptomyces sp. NPDC058092 TaxID=3346336 RepID=UPI0036ECE6D8